MILADIVSVPGDQEIVLEGERLEECLKMIEGFEGLFPDSPARLRAARVIRIVIGRSEKLPELGQLFGRRWTYQTEPVSDDGIMINGNGTVIGKAERVEEFREFCRMRGKLLD